MKPLVRFWNERYGVGRPLETDSWLRRAVNSYVVAGFMNRFPKAAIKFFSRSRGELARLLFVEREGGSYRVLRTMYAFDQPHARGDLLNRVLMHSPAIKAARNRRHIAQWMLDACLRAMPPGPPRLVMAIGGGDGCLEAEVIARAGLDNVYYCGVDRDERAVGENRAVLEKHGLEDRGFTRTGSIADRSDVEETLAAASRRFGVEFDGLSVTVCQGIIEYLDIGSQANDALAGMLGAIHACTRPDGGLVLSQTDFHDRVTFLENGLGWYMRLRGSGEVARELERAGWRISLCEQEPMRLITMCLATKSGVQAWRLDAQSPLREPHVARLEAFSDRR
ncbi:MAG: hypothetical protein JW809_02305 [Pirellulales bacterium]|nr:hypothetical protein [Pirellulales bacterium]